MDKDSKGQRKLEDCGGGLLPAVEGQRRTEQTRAEDNRTQFSANSQSKIRKHDTEYRLS